MKTTYNLTQKRTKYSKRLLSTKRRIVIQRGGTRSSKTYTTVQMILDWLMTGELRDGEFMYEGKCTIVRKYSTTIGKTIQKDLEEIIDSAYWLDENGNKVEESVRQYISINKTEKTYKFDGRVIEFLGADDPQKIRGHKSDILYCNEANELNYKKEFFQLMIRTTGCILMDFNPSDPYTWIRTEIEQKRSERKGDVDVLVSTYKDNQFLPIHMTREIEDLEHTDDKLWKVYGKGEYGVVKGIVFPSFEVVDDMPDELSKVGYGMDFGFTNDPTTLIKCGVLNGNELYIDELVYDYGLFNNEIAKLCKSNDVKGTIWADSSAPKDIDDLYNRGIQIKGAKKGAGSIETGINIINQFNIKVTKRSLNVQKELVRYKYKENKNGDFMNQPIDAFNHAIDAIRYYAISMLITKKPNRWKVNIY